MTGRLHCTFAGSWTGVQLCTSRSSRRSCSPAVEVDVCAPTTQSPPLYPMRTAPAASRLISKPPRIPPKHPPEPPPRPEPNELQNETSRYLLDHAMDRVDWLPWGEKAFARAKALGRPIFLSSGFATCHWCHVMQRHINEPHIAVLLNENFVCIKVDREERPDVDSVYMSFVQAISGRGGWPMTVFLTPELVPFVGTTYLPADKLSAAIKSIAARWNEQRDSVQADGAKVLEALRDLNEAKRKPLENGELGLGTVTSAFKAAEDSFDVRYGGFGPPPKFPRASLFEFLLGIYRLFGADSRIGREAIDMMDFTLLKMMQGGIYDHLGGGFFRYSMDAAWHVPHFEKLLSDQSQLALSYLSAYCVGRDHAFRLIVEDTLDYCLRRMCIYETGAFASAIDADSVSPFAVGSNREVQEGAFYTFSEWELKLMLGEPAASVFTSRYGIKSEGNLNEGDRGSDFGGLNILRISKSVEYISEETGIPPDIVEQILVHGRKTLLDERNRRPKPPVDDLIIVCWNGMAISAFARAGRTLGEARYLDAAFRAMDHIMSQMVMKTDDDLNAVFLSRAYRSGHGRGRVGAFADDYCACIQACIDCFETAPPSSGAKYLAFALQLQRALDQSFWDEGNGGYFSSPEGDSSILLRQKENYDGAEASPSSVAALNCIRLASLTGDQSLWQRARKIANSFSATIEKSPLAMPLLLVSVQAFVGSGTKKVVVIGSDTEATEFLSEFWSRGLPRFVALLRLPMEGPSDELSTLLSPDRRLIRGRGCATAYICTGIECLEPTTSLERFVEQLDYLEKVMSPRSVHAEMRNAT